MHREQLIDKEQYHTTQNEDNGNRNRISQYRFNHIVKNIAQYQSGNNGNSEFQVKLKVRKIQKLLPVQEYHRKDCPKLYGNLKHLYKLIFLNAIQ